MVAEEGLAPLRQRAGLGTRAGLSAVSEAKNASVAASLRLISWPFDLGIADVGVGAGGRDLARDAELRGLLEAQGWDVSLDVVPGVDERRPETARVFELNRRLAHRVRTAVAEDAFPLVLGGNCNSCLGTVSGLRPARIGVVWFDAHADFDTTDDNLSGYFDVFALAILTGSAWRTLRETIPGFAPVDERDVVLAGVRDLEPYQRDFLDRSAVRTVPGAMDAHSSRRSTTCARESTASTFTSTSTRSTTARRAPTSTPPAGIARHAARRRRRGVRALHRRGRGTDRLRPERRLRRPGARGGPVPARARR